MTYLSSWTKNLLMNLKWNNELDGQPVADRVVLKWAGQMSELMDEIGMKRRINGWLGWGMVERSKEVWFGRDLRSCASCDTMATHRGWCIIQISLELTSPSTRFFWIAIECPPEPRRRVMENFSSTLSPACFYKIGASLNRRTEAA